MATGRNKKKEEKLIRPLVLAASSAFVKKEKALPTVDGFTSRRLNHGATKQAQQTIGWTVSDE